MTDEYADDDVNEANDELNEMTISPELQEEAVEPEVEEESEPDQTGQEEPDEVTPEVVDVPEPDPEDESPAFDIEAELKQIREALTDEFGADSGEALAGAIGRAIAPVVAKVESTHAQTQALLKVANAEARAAQATKDKADFDRALKSNKANAKFADEARKLVEDGTIVGEDAYDMAFALCRGRAGTKTSMRSDDVTSEALVAASVGGGVSSEGDEVSGGMMDLTEASIAAALNDPNSGIFEGLRKQD